MWKGHVELLDRVNLSIPARPFEIAPLPVFVGKGTAI